MKDRDEILRQLFRAAAQIETPPQMPFGFDTRVLAGVRQIAPNGSALIAVLLRRVAAIAVAVIALAATALYGASVSASKAEVTNEYSMVDSVIQTNLSE